MKEAIFFTISLAMLVVASAYYIEWQQRRKK